MDAKDYCRSIEVELYGWKAKMYDMIRKVDQLRNSDKEKVHARVEELHKNIADMERLVEQLQTKCPIEFGSGCRFGCRREGAARSGCCECSRPASSSRTMRR